MWGFWDVLYLLPMIDSDPFVCLRMFQVHESLKKGWMESMSETMAVGQAPPILFRREGKAQDIVRSKKNGWTQCRQTSKRGQVQYYCLVRSDFHASWWENMQAAGYNTTIDRGQCRPLVSSPHDRNCAHCTWTSLGGAKGKKTRLTSLFAQLKWVKML